MMMAAHINPPITTHSSSDAAPGLDVVYNSGEEAVEFALSESANDADVRGAGESDSKRVAPKRFAVETEPSRDALLTDFGMETLKDRYLLPGESYQDLFARVAAAYADDADHAQRVY